MQAQVKTKRLAIIRTEASSKIGMGHLMRCLALAEGLRARGFRVIFVVKNHLNHLSEIIRKNGYKVEFIPLPYNNKEDARLFVNYINKYGPSVAITDLYSVDSLYLQQIKKTGCLSVILSGVLRKNLYSDVIINHNLGIHKRDYLKKTRPGARLLLGPKYFLLRRELLAARRMKKTKNNKQINLLVSLGGSDASNVILEILKGLRVLKDSIFLNVVIGKAYKLAGRIKGFAKNEFINSRVHINPPQIAKLMSRADIAISGGGISCYELAYLGVPNIIIAIAGNQRPNLVNLTEKGIALGLGEADLVKESDIKQAVRKLIVSERPRNVMSIKGRKLVDGRGAERVAGIIEGIYKDRYADKRR